MDTMPAAFIVGAARTPVAKINGNLSPFSATELGAAAIQGAVVRSGIPLELFSHVYMGHVLQAGTGQSPAKQAAIRAGLPETVEATTINKVCASGLKAITLAAQEIMLGHGAALVAGGMESMSNVPMYKRKRKNAMDPNSSDGEQGSDGMQDGLLNPYDGLLMGSCAEQLAVRYHVSRAEQDKCAIIAYRKASSACRKQAFLNEISPVPFSITKSGQVTSDVIRDKTLFQRLSALPPAFSDTGTITAGNSSTLADGASAVILANGVTARKYCQGASILAKIISFADASEVPSDFAVAPSKAVQIALDRAKLTIEDISLWEINEAFALVVLVNQEILKLDSSKVNVNGGAIALGHPLGSSGSRILVTLVHQLERGQYGVAAICNGGGGATAVVVQRLDVGFFDDPEV